MEQTLQNIKININLIKMSIIDLHNNLEKNLTTSNNTYHTIVYTVMFYLFFIP